MVRVLIALVVTMLIGNGAFAGGHDIDPKENLGSLKVLLPNLSGEPKFYPKNLTVVFEIGRHSNYFIPGEVKDVEAGTGCLRVAYDNSYDATQCGIVINKKQLTTVTLAALKVNWEPMHYDIDIGPAAAFFIQTNDVDRKITRANISDLKNTNNRLFILPAMNITLNVYAAGSSISYQQNQRINAGEFANMTVNSPEFRGTILLDMVDGPAKTPEIDSNYLVANYLVSGRSSGYTLAPDAFFKGRTGRVSGSSYNPNSFIFAHSGLKQSIRAFPLATNASGFPYYEIAASEHPVVAIVKSGETIRIPIVTVNVHNYQSDIPGQFVVFSNRGGTNELQEIFFPTHSSYYPRHSEFQTNESMFLPFGYKYRFDFYITDKLGRRSLQDQIPLDLSKEGR